MSSLAVTVSGSGIDDYVKKQRQRLEAIREATQRERELLQGRGSASWSTGNGADVAAPSSPRGTSAEAALFTSPTKAFALERAGAMKVRDDLRARAEDLGDQLAKVRKEEHQVATDEMELDRRVQRAEDRKRDLIGVLKAMQMREDDFKRREAVAAEREEALKQRADALRHRERELSHQQGVVHAEISQREMLLQNAEANHAEKAADYQRQLQRLRQRLADAEGRVRTSEMQLAIRGRSLDDLERAVMRDEMRMRDGEAQALERLRRAIEDRKEEIASLGTTATARDGTPPPAARTHHQNTSVNSSAAMPSPLPRKAG